MIDKIKLLKHIQLSNGNSSIGEIEDLINKQDREQIENEQKSRFSYEIWDKKSPIKGIPATKIKSSINHDFKQVYLIYIDNKLVYFQDHKPNESGYISMTKSEAEKEAQEFINKKIEEYTDDIIAKNVIKTIMSK